VRASSFGSVAGAYDRYRPSPPLEAVDWVLGSEVGVAADIGAGTGALTRQLARRAGRVIAVEPDERMLEVLARRSPDIPALRSWAESLPVRSGCLDAVTVSSAWHWMEPERTLAEVGRVLRPGGVFGVIWNGADRSEGWVGELLGPRDPSPGDRDLRSRHRFELPPGAPFTGVERTVLTWSMVMDRHQLVGLAGTYSSMITMAPDQRDQELARVQAMAASLAGDGVIELPMGCRCWRAVRARCLPAGRASSGVVRPRPGTRQPATMPHAE
jgi:SAM-dependent methyltransferase